MLTLDATTHEYLADGREIPSVTQIISTIQVWSGIPPAVLEHARARGSRVDDAVNQFDDGCLDINRLEDELIPYVMAWRDFKISTKCTVLASQVMGHNDTYWYAGTLDKIVQFDGGPQFLIEIKATAQIEPVGALQTAAYSQFTDLKSRGCNRATVQLRPDGTPRLQRWKDSSDFPTFLAALTLYNWRKKYAKTG